MTKTKKGGQPALPSRRDAEKIFADGGMLASLIPGFAENPTQIDFAASVMEALSRGDHNAEPKTTMLSASTGTGKSLGYLVPAARRAIQTGRRAIISTFTIALQRQLSFEDGPVAAEIVERETGRRPLIRMRRSRSHFISPARARMTAARLLEDGSDPALVGALRDVADWAEQELIDWTGKETPETEGLFDVWAEANPAHAEILNGLDNELYRLDGTCDAAEQVLWQAHQDHAKRADVIIMTHASTLIDAKFGGALLRIEDDLDEERFSSVIFDEADRLEQAARSALGQSRSIDRMITDRHMIDIAMRSDALTNTLLGIEAFQVCERHHAMVEALIAVSDEDTRIRTTDNRIQITPRMIERLEEVQGSTLTLCAILDKCGPTALNAKALSKYLRNRHAAFADILSHLGDDDRLFDVRARRSPTRQSISLIAEPRFGATIISRMWNTQAVGRTDALIFTSATLADPDENRSNASTWTRIARTIGLTKRVNDLLEHDLCGVFEPREFGSLSFALAPPDAPSPTSVAQGETGMNPEAVAYVANVVAMAAGRPSATRMGSSRTLVLATSFSDAVSIGQAVADKMPGARVMVRTAHHSVNAGIAFLKAHPDAILISPGMWEGINVPGTIDHLVISRLPIAPKGEAEGSIFVYASKISTRTLSDGLARTVRLLRQGIGRAIRARDDAATIWICDPRFPLPGPMQERHNKLPRNPGTYMPLLRAVDERFRKAIGNAELLPAKFTSARTRA